MKPESGNIVMTFKINAIVNSGNWPGDGKGLTELEISTIYNALGKGGKRRNPLELPPDPDDVYVVLDEHEKD